MSPLPVIVFSILKLLIRDRYLTTQGIIDIVEEELSLALLSIGYLSMPCFRGDISQDDIRLYISLGYYGFMDYAYAYWSRHLEKSVSTEQPECRITELTEVVQNFMDMHWVEPKSKITVPKSLQHRLKALEHVKSQDSILCSVYLARKQLQSATKINQDEYFLKVKNVLERVRVRLEEGPAVSTSMNFNWMYGFNQFKCPRPYCTFFYDGFRSEKSREDHVSKHERLFFCSISGCPVAELGCATFRELRKHEGKDHSNLIFDDEEEEEYPEEPPEVVSFVCSVCQASFTRRHNLNNHTRIAHNQGDALNFICQACGKAFARPGDRTRHESTSHSATNQHTCGGLLKDGSQWGCGKEFSRRDILKRHWKSEKGIKCYLPKQSEDQS